MRDNSKCTALVLNAMKLAFDGTEECFFSQLPRNCLKSHEDAIVACGQERTLCYIPSENKWYELAEMLITRNSFCHAISACHSKLYVFGGNANGDCTNAERYDPSINLWVDAKAPESAFFQFAAVTLQGFLYVVGGKRMNNNRVSTVERYNPDTNLWQKVAPLSSPRSRVGTVADGSYLYAIGGSDASAGFLDTVERYDPTRNTWDKLPSTISRRRYVSGAAIKEKVFIFGGLANEQSPGDPCEMYDPAVNMWTAIPSHVASRVFTSCVSFKGKIFVFGRFHHQGGQEMSLQIYDVDQNQWEPCTDISFGSEFFKVSRLRILRDVLAKCNVVS